MTALVLCRQATLPDGSTYQVSGRVTRHHMKPILLLYLLAPLNAICARIAANKPNSKIANHGPKPPESDSIMSPWSL